MAQERTQSTCESRDGRPDGRKVVTRGGLAWGESNVHSSGPHNTKGGCQARLEQSSALHLGRVCGCVCV